jgi:surface antigen
MGVGLLARPAMGLSSARQDPPGSRIAAAQEQALAQAHGGGPDIPVAWSDAKAGIEGTLHQEGSAEHADGCRRYRQTVILTGETLQGTAIACPRQDGAWKLLGNYSSPRISGSSRQAGLGKFTALSILKGND